MMLSNPGHVTHLASILVAGMVTSQGFAAAQDSPQERGDSAAPFQPRYVEVDVFNMGPPWLFDRREPSPGLLNGGFFDPNTIYRHHGGGIGTTHHYEGPYRHHDMGHAYYEDPASMKRFHGLGDGGAQRRGQYDYRRYFIEKYWYERGSTCSSVIPFVPSPPMHESRLRRSPSIPPVTQPVRPPIFFYQPPGEEQEEEVEPIPLEEIPDRTWAMLNEGDAASVVLMFAIDAARSPDDVNAQVGFAIASAMVGKHERAAAVMRDVLETHAGALHRPEISASLRMRMAECAANLSRDERMASTDEILIASLQTLAGQTDLARQTIAAAIEANPGDLAAAATLVEFIDDLESRRMALTRDLAADVLMMLTRAR